jgi:general secretion pathway protein K
MTAKRQRGAALVIVLLLVATLSFVMLSITTTVTTGVRRGANERLRTEMLWQAHAAERLALSIIERASSGGALKTASSEGGLFKQQIALPVERGAASLRFADASRCFNVNSLIAPAAPYAKVQAQYDEFLLLLEAIGAGGSEAQAVADAVTDFLDEDSSAESQGSEDNFYTGLTTPYRTAGGPIASVSELRAIDGITAEVYARLSPYLCAREAGRKIEINLNALTPEDGPVIYALVGPSWPLDQIRARIAETPPAGWASTADFWPGGTAPSGVTAQLDPTFIEARVLLEAEQRFVEETLIIEVPAGATGGGKPKLFSRVLGGGA